MKKDVPVKYPHSASLFQFCRQVLDHKFGDVRVIDQDVGQILGFDPADCSHWKKGKKNIRSIQAIKSISEHLGIDEKLVVDVASGELDQWEAFHEYDGYGNFNIDNNVYEEAKKDFYRKQANTWTREKEQEFRQYFSLQKEKITSIVEEIHKKINFNEAPLYLPEIVASWPDLTLRPQKTEDETVLPNQSTIKILESENNFEIQYPAVEKMRPWMRFQIAKAMATYFFKKYNLSTPSTIEGVGDHILEVQANVFASRLLVPDQLIEKGLTEVNITRDIISQLAEVFWVSRTFMNLRLKEYLEAQRKTSI
ncbi:MAG: hypothetical protein CMP10_12470 [Zetaproteobacteria bacterium]|mgnify:CR=1 FL=1|nr:hypothetical protein [Pseudobdellovibrionaceae bacterium]|tara:strand:- start:1552 stop:2478 length:927 start_codon:yes stop_codon:yes gene_type:complete